MISFFFFLLLFFSASFSASLPGDTSDQIAPSSKSRYWSIHLLATSYWSTRFFSTFVQALLRGIGHPLPIMSSSSSSTPQSSAAVKFLFGGLSGMGATCIVQPLDLVKTRLQLGSSSSAAVIREILSTSGITGLYAGLSAGLLRQATYTTTRLGVYNTLEDAATRKYEKAPTFALRVAMGMTAGGVGAIVGTPAEVALVRMMADGSLPAAERRGYRNVFDALIRVAREEGILALWRGAMPTVARAMVLNAAQLASYSQAKEVILKTGAMQEGVLLHLAASLCSGFVATCASMPVDITKTRIQNQKYVNGVPEYKNALEVLVRVVKEEGVLRLWKGFTPYFLRLGPHTVFTFLILEQLNGLHKRFA